jgi:hypothetical protein
MTFCPICGELVDKDPVLFRPLSHDCPEEDTDCE